MPCNVHWNDKNKYSKSSEFVIWTRLSWPAYSNAECGNQQIVNKKSLTATPNS